MFVEKLQAFAKARGHSMLELAFSWLAARPQVSSVIAWPSMPAEEPKSRCQRL